MAFLRSRLPGSRSVAVLVSGVAVAADRHRERARAGRRRGRSVRPAHQRDLSRGAGVEEDRERRVRRPHLPGHEVRGGAGEQDEAAVRIRNAGAGKSGRRGRGGGEGAAHQNVFSGGPLVEEHVGGGARAARALAGDQVLRPALVDDEPAVRRDPGPVLRRADATARHRRRGGDVIDHRRPARDPVEEKHVHGAVVCLSLAWHEVRSVAPKGDVAAIRGDRGNGREEVRGRRYGPGRLRDQPDLARAPFPEIKVFETGPGIGHEIAGGAREDHPPAVRAHHRAPHGLVRRFGPRSPLPGDELRRPGHPVVEEEVPTAEIDLSGHEIGGQAPESQVPAIRAHRRHRGGPGGRPVLVVHVVAHEDRLPRRPVVEEHVVAAVLVHHSRQEVGRVARESDPPAIGRESHRVAQPAGRPRGPVGRDRREELDLHRGGRHGGKRQGESEDRRRSKAHSDLLDSAMILPAAGEWREGRFRFAPRHRVCSMNAASPAAAW